MAFLVNVMRKMQHNINDPRIAKNQNNYDIDIKSDYNMVLQFER